MHFIRSFLSRLALRIERILFSSGAITLVGKSAAFKNSPAPSDLVSSHFKSLGCGEHPCEVTFAQVFEWLDSCPSSIIETGTANYGAQSTLFFDSYVRLFGGQLLTVDIDPSPGMSIKSKLSSSTRLFCCDSVQFLSTRGKSLDVSGTKLLVYLDSRDVDFSELYLSAYHCFLEFLEVYPLLVSHKGLLLIDDSPSDWSKFVEMTPSRQSSLLEFVDNYGCIPGKGAFVRQFLISGSIGRRYNVDHSYQFAWLFD